MKKTSGAEASKTYDCLLAPKGESYKCLAFDASRPSWGQCIYSLSPTTLVSREPISQRRKIENKSSYLLNISCSS